MGSIFGSVLNNFVSVGKQQLQQHSNIPNIINTGVKIIKKDITT